VTPGRLRSATLVAVLLAAGTAHADVVNARGEFVFSEPTDASHWNADTVTAADTFTLDSADDDVTIEGTVTLSTGSIVVNAGTLRFACGATLERSEAGTDRGLVLDGPDAVIEWGACPIATGRVVSEPTFKASSIVIEVPDATNVRDTDYVRIGDDDPIDVMAHADPDQKLGAGPPASGQGRPSYQKWKWWNIASGGVSGNMLALEVDEYTGELGQRYETAGKNGPYLGTRANLLPVPTAPASVAVSKDALLSRLAFGAILEDAFDGTDQWVYIPESTPTSRCSGRAAKIADTDDPAGAAHITVFGDLSGCASVPMQVVYPIRRGDPITVYRPATIDFRHHAGIALHDGTLRGAYGRLVRIGPIDGAGFSPAYGGHAHVAFWPRDASDQVCGHLIGNDFAFYRMPDGNSQAIDLPGWDVEGRWLDGSGPPDYSCLRVDGNYTHDSVRETPAAQGVHGISVHGVKNLEVHRHRSERMNDDGIWWTLGHQGDPANANTGNAMRHAIVLANLPDEDNSAECFSNWFHHYGDGEDANAIVHAGGFGCSDLMGIGCSGPVFASSSWGQTVRRFVFAGGRGDWQGPFNAEAVTLGPWDTGLGIEAPSFDCRWALDPDPACTGPHAGTADYPGTYPTGSYPHHLQNGVIVFAAAAERNGLRVHGTLADSNVLQSIGGTPGFLAAQAGIERSFISLSVANAHVVRAVPVSETTGHLTWQRIGRFACRDSVIVSEQSDTLLKDYASGAADLTAFRSVRCLYLLDDASDVGVLDEVSGLAPDAASVEDSFFRPALTEHEANGAPDGTEPSNVCLVKAARHDAADDGSARTGQAASALPVVTIPARGRLGPRDLREELRDADACPASAPEAVGLARLAVTHTMMGDFFMEQAERWSSRDLLAPRPNLPPQTSPHPTADR